MLVEAASYLAGFVARTAFLSRERSVYLGRFVAVSWGGLQGRGGLLLGVGENVHGSGRYIVQGSVM